jgi:SAM-dependent methyltransferase
LAITPDDDVVEFAPGLGVTAKMTLNCNPRSYTAIERDEDAARKVQLLLSRPNQRCVQGTAAESGLDAGAATVVYGEAMLSMQLPQEKERIVREAARLLKPGGRYGIHELCLVPGDVDDTVREGIQRGMSDEIHVGVRPLTLLEWRALLEDAGLAVTAEHTAPMHLLEPYRLVQDEGLLRALRFVWNVAIHAAARRRVLAMRGVFRKYGEHLRAVMLVARSSEPTTENAENASLP